MARRRGRGGRFTRARSGGGRRRFRRRGRKQKAGWDDLIVPLSPTLEPVLNDVMSGKDLAYVGATASSHLTGYNYQTGNFDPKFAWDRQWKPAIVRSVVWGFAKSVGSKLPGIKVIFREGKRIKIGGRSLIGGRK